MSAGLHLRVWSALSGMPARCPPPWRRVWQARRGRHRSAQVIVGESHEPANAVTGDPSFGNPPTQGTFSDPQYAGGFGVGVVAVEHLCSLHPVAGRAWETAY